MKIAEDKYNLYISVYFSQMLQDKSRKYGQQCYLIDIVEYPDDLSQEFSEPSLMAAENGSASWRSLPYFLCSDWQRVYFTEIEIENAPGLMVFLEEALVTAFDTPKIGQDIADLASSYAYHANKCHSMVPGSMQEYFGILLTLHDKDADRLTKSFVNGDDLRWRDIGDFILKTLLTNIKLTIDRLIREFRYQQSIAISDLSGWS